MMIMMKKIKKKILTEINYRYLSKIVNGSRRYTKIQTNGQYRSSSEDIKMDTPHNTLTFCAQQAKCFRKNILRNNNKLGARIIHTYWAGCVAEYATTVREHKTYGTWAYQRVRAPLHALH
jgi:hypothetical protein